VPGASRYLQQAVQAVRYQRAVQARMVVNVVSLHSVVSETRSLSIRVALLWKDAGTLALRARDATLHTSLSEIKSIKWMVFKVYLHWRHGRFVIYETSETLKIWRSSLENGANRMNDHDLYVEFFDKYRYS
jgi:hypothetical protein